MNCFLFPLFIMFYTLRKWEEEECRGLSATVILEYHKVYLLFFPYLFKMYAYFSS